MTAITLFAALALPIPLTAQPQYNVIDMGTFGGPQGFLFEQTQVLNNQGVLQNQQTLPRVEAKRTEAVEVSSFLVHSSGKEFVKISSHFGRTSKPQLN